MAHSDNFTCQICQNVKTIFDFLQTLQKKPFLSRSRVMFLKTITFSPHLQPNDLGHDSSIASADFCHGRNLASNWLPHPLCAPRSATKLSCSRLRFSTSALTILISFLAFARDSAPRYRASKFSRVRIRALGCAVYI